MFHSNSSNKWCSILPSDFYLGYNTFGVYLLICVGNMFFLLMDFWSVFQPNVNKSKSKYKRQNVDLDFQIRKLRCDSIFNVDRISVDFCPIFGFYKDKTFFHAKGPHIVKVVEIFSMIEPFHIFFWIHKIWLQMYLFQISLQSYSNFT